MKQQANDAQTANSAQWEMEKQVGNNRILSTCNLKLKSQPEKLRPPYIGIFRVLQGIGHNAFKLDLLVALQVHPVLNVLLLQ